MTKFELLWIDAWADGEDGWTWNDIRVMRTVELNEEDAAGDLLEQTTNPEDWYVEDYDFCYELVRKSNNEPVLALREVCY